MRGGFDTGPSMFELLIPVVSNPNNPKMNHGHGGKQSE
jgi:hypothetical protein